MSMRLTALRRRMAAKRLDALIVTQPHNLRYLADFPDEDAALFITAERAHILTDFRYVGMVQERCVGFTLTEISGNWSMERTLAVLVRETGANRVGFEAHHVPYATYRALRAALLDRGRALAHLVPARNLVEEIRAEKEPQELAAIERAVLLADAALAQVLRRLTTAGSDAMTERQVAWEIERTMREMGAEAAAFDVAVAAGPNSAVPHHVSGDRPLRPGEPIWIDMGARVDGYCSDLTRTFCLGEPDARFREIYDLVLRAQLSAEQALRPGVSGRVPDAAARGLIAAAGYGDAFRHGTGHGVGLAIHELPSLGLRAPRSPLRPGHVVTVEPGIYLPGWGGVRIEDMAVVTPEGCRILTTSPK